MCLCIAFCYESCFIAIERVIGIILHLEYPSALDCLLVRWVRDEMPCLVLHKISHLLIHRFDPSRIFNGFGKAFWFTNICHLHHKGIVVCHVVVIAESTNCILLMGGASKFFICHGNGFWHTSCPHNRHIKATDLIVKRVSWFVAIGLIVVIFGFGLGRDMLCSLGGSCGSLNPVEIGLSSDINISLSSLDFVLSRSFVNGSGGVAWVHTKMLIRHVLLVQHGPC